MDAASPGGGVLPNFLIIGAEKAGTTWLYSNLKRHPEIYLPETKELHFFNALDSNLNRRDHYAKLGFQWYERFFQDHAGQPAVGEVTPMYLCDAEAPLRISRDLPEVRLICSLRNPVDRAVSHYLMARAKRHTHDSFDEIVARRDERFVARGCYAAQLERYFELFGRERVLVMIFEETFADPPSALEGIGRFLGLERCALGAQDWSGKENPATSFRSPWLYNTGVRLARGLRRYRGTGAVMSWLKRSGLPEAVKRANRSAPEEIRISDSARAQLAAFYRPEIDALETLLHRPIEAWRRPDRGLGCEQECDTDQR